MKNNQKSKLEQYQFLSNQFQQFYQQQNTQQQQQQDDNSNQMTENTNQNQNFIHQLNELQNKIDFELYDLKDYNNYVCTHSLQSSQEQVRPRQNLRPKTAQTAIQQSNKPQKCLIQYSRDQIIEVQLNSNQICPICSEPFQKPATLPCDHTFCAQCILRASQIWSPKRCPLCFQEYSKFPNVNIVFEYSVFKSLKMSAQASVGDLVRVLVSEERTPAFSFGIVDSIVKGYVSSDMTTLIVEDLGTNFETDEFMETKVAYVETGSRKWCGKLSDVETIRPSQYVIGTRMLRGSLVVHQKFLKRAQVDIVVGDLDTKLMNEILPELHATQVQKIVQKEVKQVEKKPKKVDKKKLIENKEVTETQIKVEDNQQMPPPAPKLSKFQEFKKQLQQKQKMKNDNIQIIEQIRRNESQVANENNDTTQITNKPNGSTSELNDITMMVENSTKERMTQIQQGSYQVNKVRPNMSLKRPINQIEQINNLSDDEHDLASEVLQAIQESKETNTEQPQEQRQVVSQNIDQLMEQIDENSKLLLAAHYIYNPNFPKQQPPIYTPYYISNERQVNILLADECVSQIFSTLDQQQNKADKNDLKQYVRLITDFQYLTKFPQFCCNGCKLLLRIPITLECGCQYCYLCACQLQRLRLDCLGCGEPLLKKVSLKNINKKLILQMYSKVPKHTPMIDRNLPVKFQDKIGILLDEPERVNVWVMVDQNKNFYVHSTELQALNITNNTYALRATEGLAFYDGTFVILKQDKDDNTWKYFNADHYNGSYISEQDVQYKCRRLVDDLREQIVVAKLEGLKMLQQRKDAKMKLIKNEILLRKKTELKQQEEKLKKQQQEEQAVQQRLQSQLNKKQISKDVMDRRKRLGLVGMDNPNAKSHPGNIMVFQQPEQENKLQNYIAAQSSDNYQQRIIQSKPFIIQLCYLFPKVNFLCSACWHVLKRPVQLKCGHIICRTCCCLYQAANNKCMLCRQHVGSILDIQPDEQLQMQLYQFDEQYNDRQIDIGVFVSTPEFPKLGIVRQIIKTQQETQLLVQYPQEARLQPQKQVTVFEFKQVIDADLALGSACVVHSGRLRGILGLITSVPQQKSISAIQSRQQYQAADDEIVLDVCLETGARHLFPLSALRKAEMKMQENWYQIVQKQKIDSEEAEQIQLREQIQQEIDAMTAEEIEDTSKSIVQIQQTTLLKSESAANHDIWTKPAAGKHPEKRKKLFE